MRVRFINVLPVHDVKAAADLGNEAFAERQSGKTPAKKEEATEKPLQLKCKLSCTCD